MQRALFRLSLASCSSIAGGAYFFRGVGAFESFSFESFSFVFAAFAFAVLTAEVFALGAPAFAFAARRFFSATFFNPFSPKPWQRTTSGTSGRGGAERRRERGSDATREGDARAMSEGVGRIIPRRRRRRAD